MSQAGCRGRRTLYEVVWSFLKLNGNCFPFWWTISPENVLLRAFWALAWWLKLGFFAALLQLFMDRSNLVFNGFILPVSLEQFQKLVVCEIHIWNFKVLWWCTLVWPCLIKSHHETWTVSFPKTVCGFIVLCLLRICNLAISLVCPLNINRSGITEILNVVSGILVDLHLFRSVCLGEWW